MGRSSRNSNPLISMGLEQHVLGAPGVDPDYVMQLVNDVRKFADVLLNLKEAFHSKGEFGISSNMVIVDLFERSVGKCGKCKMMDSAHYVQALQKSACVSA